MKQLRRAIRVCAVLLAILLLLPILYGGYSLLRYGTRWRTSEYNTYQTGMKSSVIAGNIYDRAGVLLASSDPETGARVYPGDEAQRKSLAHVVGNARGTVKNAVETFMADYLYGANMSYSERFAQTMRGKLHGDDVTLTIDSGLQRFIGDIFPDGKNGAVVVMNYKTGEIYAMNSFPSFDPASSAYVGINQSLNRATRWLSAPGSTFKIVTLAAALQNIPGAEEQTYECVGELSFGEHQRTVRDYGGTVHGQLTLRQAFVQSCNSTFAALASQMGDRTLRRTAEAFGIGDDFTFRDLVVENSSYAASDRELLGADLAWTGAGQNQLGLSPLHMCMIAAAVANDGVMMEPRLLLSAVSPTGVQRAAFEAVPYRTALPAQTARTIRSYMRDVVAGGTGRSAQVSGLSICAKTGTAEIDTQKNDNAWFVGFSESEALPVAICIVVADSGTGGSVAAPLARQIFQYMLGK
ncbi:MAG: penicillin-binding protein 2 [Clostridia bacterium]|nr:penicillin-binding protein 2 [Clostridia bacterium]